MDFSASAIKKSVTTSLKRLTQLIVFIAVVSAAINLYFHFSTPKEKQVSFQQALSIAQERNSSVLKQAINQDKNQELKISGQLSSYLLCEYIGDACGPNLVSSNETYQNSMAGGISKLFLFPISNPPASSIYVAGKTMQNAGFIPPSYAAPGDTTNPRGLGFASIEYIAPIWKSLRDLSYIVIAIIMLTIGFMIMFRMKLGSQTVIAIENSIPRIIVALLGITFSFAIAGFMIDLMYVSILIIAGVFGAMGMDGYSSKEIVEKYMFAGADEIVGFIFEYGFWNTFWHLPNAILGVLGSGINITFHLIGSVLGWFFVVSKVVAFIANAFSVELEATTGVSAVVANLSGALGFPSLVQQLIKLKLGAIGAVTIGLVIGALIVRAIIYLLIIFTAIQLGFKVFWMMMTSYIRILLLIIFAPVLLLSEAIPGKSVLTSWMRNLLGEISTFPITIMLFLVGALLIKSAFLVDACSGKILPGNPDCSVGAFPFVWGFDAKSFSIIVGFGFLFLIPHYVQSFKKALNPNAMDLAPDAGIGMFFGSVGRFGKVALGGATKTIGRGMNDALTERFIERLPPGMKDRAKKSLQWTQRNPNKT
jgi:hypothetical protein